ncbi:hypothetical protein [Burkholderia pseudomallei]|uniref:hypothetical protein n=1 Tax=Burkholderia pseudomallei TaxID=28450 RepID=UPI000537554F|nr:hypothetical protein [Burkholderia pseudomallei]KGX39754.1 hypothetical protein Y043_2855 [Burkholderia pseudomallei MSHR2138]KGX47856.1 hypothetical protein Y600_6015 [Burkholderia pseudomallei MSHR3709]
MKENNETITDDNVTYLTPSDAAPQRSLITIEDLRASLVKRQRELGKTEQQSKNLMTALSQFQKFSSMPNESYADEIFGASFDNHLNDHILSMTGDGYSPQSVRDRLSLLLKIKEHFQEMLTNEEMPTGFADCLRWAMRRQGLRNRDVIRTLGVDDATFHHWVSRRGHPTAKFRPLLLEMEKLLQLEPGSLISRSGIDFRETLKGVRNGKANTDYSARIVAGQQNPYALNNPNETIRKEWADFTRHKSKAILGPGEKRNASWRVKDRKRVSRKLSWAGQTLGGKNLCVTADVTWGFLSDVLGFITRPDLAGSLAVPAETLSIAWLSDSERVLACVQYQQERSGTYSRGTYTVISHVVQLLRPETGFLWQNVQFADKLSADMHARIGYDPSKNIEERKQVWRQWCEANRDRLYEVYNNLEEQKLIRKSRDPSDRVREILAKRRPVEALIEMIARMKETLPSIIQPLQRKAFQRDLMLIQMLTVNPLRIHNYAIMTWRSDNSGNLYQTEDGAWRIRFAPEDFKNQKGAAQTPYDVGVSKHLWEDIEFYLKEVRPSLLGGEKTDFMFRPGKKTANITDVDGEEPWNADTMSERVTAMTRTFVPNSKGFGPHAFRHIIATDYLKNHPHDYMSVAYILHDKLETVINEYAHVSTGHGFSLYTDYFDDIFAKAA